MAKKKPKASSDSAAKDLLLEARERYQKCVEFERINRQNYRDDMKFIHVPGEQWDPLTRVDRGKDRPMYEFNHTRVTVKNVINEMRSNRPSAKFRPTENADQPIAEAREGIAKNICNASDFDSVRDYAAEHQVGGGFAAWRIETKYASDESFDQDIIISIIPDPLCIYADYTSQDPLKRDANYWFVISQITKEAYEAKYKTREVVEFSQDEVSDLDQVNDDDRVWVAEYWVKKPVERHLCQLSNGMVIDKMDPNNVIPEGVEVVKERKFLGSSICQYIISDDSILEGPNEWAGPDFPFVIIYGDYALVDGRVNWCGVARYMKDAQRAHNWAMTSVYEDIASAPSNQYWATAKQAEGQSEHWNTAIKKNIPFLLYNVDPQAPGAPQRSTGKQVPVALIQAAQMSTDEMKACSGIFDAAIGQVSNETSGRAIANRAAQGRISTFNFQDNMLKGVRRTYEILNSLIPKIYDTQRSIRILGEDGTEKFVAINDGINDLNRGKYDIAITSGPSFATQRMEAADAYIGLAQGNPQVMAAAGDLIFKSMDLPFSDQIADRIRLTLPPPIQSALQKGKQIPPEAQAALAQADQMMQQVQAHGQLVEKAAADAQEQQAQADKANNDVKLQVAQLKVQQANFATEVADFKTLIAQTEAEFAKQAAAQGNETEKLQLSAQLDTALANLTQQAAQMFQQYAGQLTQMHGEALQRIQPQVVVASPPKRKRAISKRINGELHTEILEEPMQAA